MEIENMPFYGYNKSAGINQKPIPAERTTMIDYNNKKAKSRVNKNQQKHKQKLLRECKVYLDNTLEKIAL
ncbi:MAG: hypothetical protein KGZ86_01700, partial [Candidatus Latescibacteria bacterium]|nr:hypothetical protein [Candidatus Latescibacterota bacterium]